MRSKVSMKTRTELVSSKKEAYHSADRQGKTEILNVLVRSTGCTRKHLIALLNATSVERRKRPSHLKALSPEALQALVFIWHVTNRICSKRLVPFIPEVCENLENHGHLTISDDAREQLFKVSAATVDRALRNERLRCGRSLSHTKRAALVKNKVPVRTFTDWSDAVPGFFEIDTVGHSSSNPNGPFLDTLNMTDIATCWTIPIALRAKSALDVLRALDASQSAIPFPLLGIDFDNGPEFLNELLIEWCDKRGVTYTRSRAYKKNDQAWIEEKNRSVVRKNVGSERYSCEEAFKVLTELYTVLYSYFNFFQPCQKLLEKRREGGKTFRKHDAAKTPYQRVLEHPAISRSTKKKLKLKRQSLDILQLKQSLESLQVRLKEFAEDAPNPVLAVVLAQRNATHKFANRIAADRAPTREKVVEETKSKLRPRLRQLIAELTPGTRVRAKDLSQFGDFMQITRVLHLLKNQGVLRSASWGVYEVVCAPQTPRTNTLESKVLKYLKQQAPLTAVSWRELSHLGDRQSTTRCLHSLHEKGLIQRAARGAFVYITTSKKAHQKLIRAGTNYFEATV